MLLSLYLRKLDTSDKFYIGRDESHSYKGVT